MDGGVVASLLFFQAEDGIRDIGVTGVQTCALPIWLTAQQWTNTVKSYFEYDSIKDIDATDASGEAQPQYFPALFVEVPRSEERRVGKECRPRWPPYH